VCGALSLLLLVPALFSFPLAIAVGVMARKDLEKMGLGSMDPGGEEQTLAARRLAPGGVAASLVALTCLGPCAALNLIDLLFPRY
jgi:hypothetical protein